MKLKCKNPKCLNEWEYKGNSSFYATCSKCKSSVRIKKPNVKQNEEE